MGTPIAEPEFRSLLNLSRHRGPDGQDVFRDSHCALGFNRLAILDLSPAAMQPMRSPSGRSVLVFNGEIYNFKELARAHGIENQPHCQTSDSAVLAHLADILSPEALAEELDGMFAIALYDSRNLSLTLIRDFAGVKPFFYSVGGDRVVFASQFDQVLHHPLVDRGSENARAVRDYLQLGYMPAPETLIAGVEQVEPGRMVTFDRSLHASHRTYFELSRDPIEGGALETSDAALESVTAALSNACHQTLVSDVPLGCFLSGGIDSPLVAALAHDRMPALHGYTVGVDDPELNEADIARSYCQALGIEQTILHLSGEAVIDQAEAHFRAFSDPVGDYGSLPTFAITREARRHATVMLSGDGGDELFWGYPRFYKFLRSRRLLSMPRPLRRLFGVGMRATGKDASHGVDDGLSAWMFDTQAQILSDDVTRILPGVSGNSDGIVDLYRFCGPYSTAAISQWLRHNEFYGHLQKVLAKVDRASMGNSLEVRVPFLCKDVINTAWRIRMDAANVEPKWILKQALAKRLGSTPMNHQKMGFTVPINDWLRTVFKDEVRELTHHPVFARELMSTDVVRTFTESFFSGAHDHGSAIWILYTLQKWAAVHLERQINLR
ncbi:MAG: asparagine synthase (glutamine-hydrolyzing) [Verrucomicrobiae bacterium]|nr:asparagine synthase (glutamine-hydrolyzing) [Verrucomicrobiae bacterium]